VISAAPRATPRRHECTDRNLGSYGVACVASSHGKLVNRGETTYNGQSVVEIYEATKKGTLYVSASGTPYPVAFVKTKQGSAGKVTFDRRNESVTLSPPKGALDLSQFGSGLPPSGRGSESRGERKDGVHLAAYPCA
jgi:hypothetical protein